MVNRMRALIGCGAFLALACLTATPEAAGQTLLVIPGRHTVVQLAFDAARLRAVEVVAYDARSPAGEVVLHLWDRRMQDWVSVTLDDYRRGALFEELPRDVVLVGKDAELPREVVEASRWGGEVRRVSTLKVVDLVNALNESLQFSPAEWRWLARRYGLSLVDLNSERRRHGRYGRPGAGPPWQRPLPERGAQVPLIPVEEARPPAPPAYLPQPLPQDK